MKHRRLENQSGPGNVEVSGSQLEKTSVQQKDVTKRDNGYKTH